MVKYILIDSYDKNFKKPIFDSNENSLVLFSHNKITLKAKSSTIIKLNYSFYCPIDVNIFISVLYSYRTRHIFLNNRVQIKPKENILIILTNYGNVDYTIKENEKFLKLDFQKKIKPKLLIKHNLHHN